MKIMTKFITTTFALLLAATVAQAEGKTATVNVGRLVDNYWKTKQAKAALDSRKADLEKEGKAMITTFKKDEETYKTLLAASMDQAVSETEREKKKTEAADKVKSLREQQDTILKFQKTANESLDDQAKRILINVFGDVRKQVESYAKQAGYALVIDSAAESSVGTPVVMFSTGENDITEAVLTQLNSTAPPEAAATTEKKPEAKPDAKK
jgi:Skp family chaperone for outer membrane proteins